MQRAGWPLCPGRRLVCAVPRPSCVAPCREGHQRRSGPPVRGSCAGGAGRRCLKRGPGSMRGRSGRRHRQLPRALRAGRAPPSAARRPPPRGPAAAGRVRVRRACASCAGGVGPRRAVGAAAPRARVGPRAPAVCCRLPRSACGPCRVGQPLSPPHAWCAGPHRAPGGVAAAAPHAAGARASRLLRRCAAGGAEPAG